MADSNYSHSNLPEKIDQYKTHDLKPTKSPYQSTTNVTFLGGQNPYQLLGSQSTIKREKDVSNASTPSVPSYSKSAYKYSSSNKAISLPATSYKRELFQTEPKLQYAMSDRLKTVVSPLTTLTEGDSVQFSHSSPEELLRTKLEGSIMHHSAESSSHALGLAVSHPNDDSDPHNTSKPSNTSSNQSPKEVTQKSDSFFAGDDTIVSGSGCSNTTVDLDSLTGTTNPIFASALKKLNASFDRTHSATLTSYLLRLNVASKSEEKILENVSSSKLKNINENASHLNITRENTCSQIASTPQSTDKEYPHYPVHSTAGPYEMNPPHHSLLHSASSNKSTTHGNLSYSEFQSSNYVRQSNISTAQSTLKPGTSTQQSNIHSQTHASLSYNPPAHSSANVQPYHSKDQPPRHYPTPPPSTASGSVVPKYASTPSTIAVSTPQSIFLPHTPARVQTSLCDAVQSQQYKKETMTVGSRHELPAEQRISPGRATQSFNTSTAITTLHPPVTVANPTITAAYSPIATVNAPLSTVNAPISTVNPPISTVNPPIATVNPPISTVNPPIATVNPPIATVNPPMSTVNPLIATVNPPMSTVNPPIATVDPPIAAVNPPIAAATPQFPTSIEPLTVNGKQYLKLNLLGQGGSSKVYEVTMINNNQVSVFCMDEKLCQNTLFCTRKLFIYSHLNPFYVCIEIWPQVFSLDSREVLAVKIVQLAGADEQLLIGYKNEVEILQRLQKSQRVIKLYNWYVFLWVNNAFVI